MTTSRHAPDGSPLATKARTAPDLPHSPLDRDGLVERLREILSLGVQRQLAFQKACGLSFDATTLPPDDARAKAYHSAVTNLHNVLPSLWAAAEQAAEAIEAAAQKNERWRREYLDASRAEDAGVRRIAELERLLRAVLKRDAEWGPSGALNDCACINLSRDAEREYETGTCPHQVARAALSASGGKSDQRRSSPAVEAGPDGPTERSEVAGGSEP